MSLQIIFPSASKFEIKLSSLVGARNFRRRAGGGGQHRACLGMSEREVRGGGRTEEEVDVAWLLVRLRFLQQNRPTKTFLLSPASVLPLLFAPHEPTK